MAKEIKPLVKKIFSLDKYKAENKLNDGVAEKPLDWIPVSTAFQKVSGLKGIAKGYINIVRGYSNTGKTTLLCETAVSCQKLGILPVIIDTDHGFNWQHARDLGLEFEEIYAEVINEETGEIESQVVDYKGFFIYINNEYLINNFGKLKDKNRDEASVEDVASFMNKLLDDQTKGNLDVELCFLFDSIGSLDCDMGIISNNRSNLWTAGSYEQSMKGYCARISGSRKQNKKYTNTFLGVNKVWYDGMSPGAGILKSKGGEFFYFNCRILILMGGVQSHGTKKLIAKANGKDYIWGTQTKLAVEKNHITGSSYKGEIISTAHGFILPEDAESYKKQHKNFILSKIGLSSDSSIEFLEEDNGKIEME